tara:strand:- start:148 stop:1014 length:867 start_codon:yes stop_codon:yes gene_type:complete
MKLIIFTSVLIISCQLNCQELYIQNFDKLKGSERVLGQSYTTVYDNDSHIYRYFNDNGNEIFLIKSFNENGEEVNLSIEKNKLNESIEIIINNKAIATVVNSIIYDLNMVEIGKLFDGRSSKKKISDFWEGVDYSDGNISIYDFKANHKIGSFFMKEEVDYYAILGIASFGQVDNMDAREIKRSVREVQKVYKKLLKSYNLKKNPNDKSMASKVNEINTAYDSVLLDLGVSNKKDKKILGFIPDSYLAEERRTNWSDDEGYVPYSKRVREDYNPDSTIEKQELFPNKN